MASDDTPNDQEIWRRATRSDPPPPSPCPDLNDLARYVDGGMESNAAALIEEHLCSCADCRQAVAVARSSTTAPRAMEKRAAVTLAGVLRWTGMAAAVALACALGFRLGQARAVDGRALAMIEESPPATAPLPSGDQP